MPSIGLQMFLEMTLLLQLLSTNGWKIICPNLGAGLADIHAEDPSTPTRDPLFLGGQAHLHRHMVCNANPLLLFPASSRRSQMDQHGTQNRQHTHIYTGKKEGHNFLICGNPNTHLCASLYRWSRQACHSWHVPQLINVHYQVSALQQANLLT